MNCEECGHLFSRHDNYGCINSYCDCMRTTKELTGEYSLPQLARGIKFQKEGYTKQYSLPPNEMFVRLQEAVNDMSIFEGYEIVKGTRMIKTIIGPEKRPLGLLLDSFSLTGRNWPIEVGIEVDNSNEMQDGSKLILRFHHLLQAYRYLRSPLFPLITGQLEERRISHLFANEFIGAMDEHLEKMSSSVSSQGQVKSTDTGNDYFDHNQGTMSIIASEKRARYRSFKRARILIILLPILLWIIFKLLRPLF